MTLTAFLTDWALTAPPQHPLFPALRQPPNFHEQPRAICMGCPQGGKTPQACKTGHKSYDRGWLLDALPTEYRFHLQRLRAMQYMVDRLSDDIYEMYGTAQNFLINGINTLNFADYTSWEVLSVDGDTAVLQADEDPGAKQIALHRILNGDLQSYTTYGDFGPPQPNDIGRFQYPSPYENKMLPRVLSVTLDRTLNQATVVFDKDVSNAMYDTRLDQSVPVTFTLRLYRQAGDPKQWFPVVEPSVFHSPKTSRDYPKTDTYLAADFGDGRFVLTRTDGTNGRIVRPRAAAGFKPASLVVETRTVSSPVAWVDISSSCYARLQSQPIGPGPDGKGEYKSWLCLGTTDYLGEETLTTLLTDVTEIRIKYIPEATPDQIGAGSYCVPCGRRCRHAIPNPTCNGVSTSLDMDDGEAQDAEGRWWHCKKRRFYTLEDNPDLSWRQDWHAPSGVTQFTPDCWLTGICDHFQPIDEAGQGDRMSTLTSSANTFFRELIMRQDFRVEYPTPGVNSYRNTFVRRMGHPSIYGLTSGLDPTNPIGWHEKYVFPQWAAVIKGDMATETDMSGNFRFAALYGTPWDLRYDWADIVHGDSGTYPPPGLFPTLISGWTTKSDPLGTLYTDTNDPYRSHTGYDDQVSYRLKRDTAEDSSRALVEKVRSVPGDETVLLPNVDPSNVLDTQNMVDATFRAYGIDQVHAEFDYRSMIQVKPLRDDDKTPAGNVVTGTIASVSVTDGIATIDLENQEQVWSHLVTIGGESFDQIEHFYAGGTNVQAPDWKKVRSFYGDDSTFGGATDLAASGDHVKFDFNPDGDAEFDQKLFLIVRAIAFGGAQDPDWGPGTRHLNFEPRGGFFQVPHLQTEIDDTTDAVVAQGTFHTAANYGIGVTTFTLTVDPPVAVGNWIKNRDTGEIMKVTGFNASTDQIAVLRAQGGTSAVAITTAHELAQILVFEPGTNTEYTLVSSLTRPSLSAGECWVDDGRNRIHYSNADRTKSVDLSYLAFGFPAGDFSNHAYHVSGHVIGQTLDYDGSANDYAYPVFDTGLSAADFDGAGGTTVKIEGNTLTAAASPPTLTTYVRTLCSPSNHVVLQFHMDHAGLSGQVAITPSGAFPSPGDVADSPGFGTGAEWGRNRDRIIVQDENGWLADNAAALVGQDFVCMRQEAILDSRYPVTLKYTPYQEDAYVTADEADYLVEYGRGRIYLSPSLTTTMQAAGNICIELS